MGSNQYHESQGGNFTVNGDHLLELDEYNSGLILINDDDSGNAYIKVDGTGTQPASAFYLAPGESLTINGTVRRVAITTTEAVNIRYLAR